MKTVACIGNFDGVHIGHQALIEKTIAIAKEKGLSSAAITFAHLKEDELCNLNKKEELLYQYGLDEVIVIDFDETLKLFSYGKFIEFFLNRFELDTLVCGEDFTFGHQREGTADKLMDYSGRNFEVCVLPTVMLDGRKVSTSWLKELRQAQDHASEVRLLNREKL